MEKNWILEEAKKAEHELLEVRRALHQIPEIGDELPRTKKYVCEYLDKIAVPYRLLDGCDGVIAEIKGATEGKTLAFRADMDGLHLDEETGVPFKSEIRGQMHGCGHDAHTAILLLTAKLLKKYEAQLRGNVRLLFQTGEETGSGAKKMIAEGALDGVDAIYALHVGNLAGDSLSAGDFAILCGPVSAGKNKFTITVRGKGTHSAFPERGVDPILIAARIVNGCEELAAREVAAGTAAVLSFGSLQAGEDHNTIPETAVIKGSIRCQNPQIRAFLGERLKEIATLISSAYRADCDVELKIGSSTVINNSDAASLAADAVSHVFGKEKVLTALSAPLMGSDDFANYAQRIPATYFMLHTNNVQKGMTEANHSPRFDLDEEVLFEGVAAYIAIAFRFCENE